MRNYKERSDTREFGPRYDIGSTALVSWRRKARNGLRSLSAIERRAYGAAVEAAVLKAQRPAKRESPVQSMSASGTYHNNGADIEKAIRAQHSAGLHRQGRGRTPDQWQTAYDLAIKDRRYREMLAKERAAA